MNMKFQPQNLSNGVHNQTFNEVVLVSVLGDFECCPLLPFGRWLRQKVIDELVVDLGKGYPDGELLVVSTVQLYAGLIMLELCETAT